MKIRWGRLIVGGLAIGMVALVVRHERSQQPTLSAPPPSLAGYSITYAVEVHAGATQVNQRSVQVRRPRDSRDATFTDVAAQPDTGFLSNGRHLFGYNGANVLDYGERVTAVAPGDYRLGSILRDLVRLDLARKTPTVRTIAGRSCVVYRFGSPLGDVFKAPSQSEYADDCIDADGLLLAERWYFKGKLLRDTEATHVSTAVPGDDAFAQPTEELKPNPTNFGAVKDLSLAKPPKTGLPYWVARRAPFGFVLRARVRGIASNTTGGSPQVTDIAYIDTYQRGHDLITVTHRELGAAGAPPSGFERVHAGALGRGEVNLSVSGASISFTAGKWVVTVQGPLDVARLRAFAASLRPVR